MKKLRIVGIVAVLFLLACLVGTAQARDKVSPLEEEWSKTFGRESLDLGQSVQQTSEGGYIVAGMTRSYGTVFNVNNNNQGFLGLELPNLLDIVSVASAREQIQCDPFANRYGCYLNCKDSSFKAVDKPIDEPILEPMEIEKRLWGDIDTLWMDKYLRQDKHLNGAVWYDEEGCAHYGTFKISDIDAAVWMDKHWDIAGGERESARQLYPIDTDGDGLPEILMCGLNDYYLRNTDLGLIKDNIVRCNDGYYLLDLFHKPKNEDVPGMLKLLYTNPDWKIVPLKGEDTVEALNWDDLVGKTPAEIGLDKDDRGLFGRTPSQTSSPAQTTSPSEIPTGEEKEIPGFEAVFAIAGLLAVAYIFRRRK